MFMSDERPNILWTRPMLARFKIAYAEASSRTGSDGAFTFDGHEFIVGYAKYLIEFLDTQFNTKTKKGQ